MPNKKEENRDVDMTSFMSDTFNNYLTTKNHIETKLNWLLIVAGVIMSTSIAFIMDKEPTINYFSLLIICFSSFICFLMCLVSLELPKWILKKPHRDGSIMFYDSKNAMTPESIYASLSNIKTREDILRQYSITMYNLIERNIKEKNKMFSSASNILSSGLIMAFLYS
jgi:hypothetical protein